MKARLRLSTQIALGILVALILGYLYQEPPLETIIAPSATPTSMNASTPAPSTPATVPTSTMDDTSAAPRPFETLPGVWLARVIVYPDSAPEIIKVMKLSSGRLTPPQPGDSHVRILAEEGIVIYELTFQPSLNLFDVPASADDTAYFFIIPDLENADRLQVTTPQGEAIYEFPLDE